MTPFLDLLFGNGNFFAGRIGQHDHLGLLTAEQPGHHVAIFENEKGRAEGGIHATVGVEDVFAQTFQPAIAQPIELRTYDSAHSIKLMTRAAVLGEG